MSTTSSISSNMSTPTKRSNTSSSPYRKKSSSLPAETVEYLKAWMMSPEHIAHPYPTEQEKAQIMADTGIELKQLTNWFVNNRKRYWKPRVEAQLQQGQPQKATSSGSSSNLIKATATNSVGQLTSTGSESGQSPTEFEKKSDQVKVVGQDDFTTFQPSPRTVRHVVSDASSFSSETASVFSSTDEDCAAVEMNEEVSNGTVSRTETVDVHVLRPLNTEKPTIADVTILPNVPSERILCTYDNCELTYRFPVDSIQDRKKVQSRRDSEIVRLKRHYLMMYLEETASLEASTKRPVSALREVDSPRKKFRRESASLWRESCESAHDFYDIDLPTLEEATLLFGFSQGLSA